MTGLPQVRVELFSILRRENGKFTTLGALLTLTIALVLFRRFRAVMVVTLGPILVLGFTNAVHLSFEFARLI